ncbi:unnamed protein product [Adineta steineri]|uniref:Uncharacterized protein n=1 Tax=Adineta steineri TaxID=433720 RepID=A0A819JN74_9BILA|nr:unnamed protein product [Adineta steineri]CAF3932611.1 unnamed protein product [Adineta steineri]
MEQIKYIIVFCILIQVNGMSIPFLNNTILTAIRPISLDIILTNYTCLQCICLALQNSSLIAFNYYPNSTCQFFINYPKTYELQSSYNSRLYFVQDIFPNASNPCCISNITFILEKLQKYYEYDIYISVDVPTPRCLLLDDDGSVVTIEQISDTASSFDRFDPETLSFRQQTVLGARPTNIAYFDYKYYIGWDVNNTISVFSNNYDNNSLRFITNIQGTTINMSAVRDMIFLNDGQIMVVASATNQRLFFFSLTNNTNYTMISTISLNYQTPHGLHRVNDSFFYVVSWDNPSLYAYNYNETTSNWTETLFVNATINSTIYGAHMTIDDCNRRWFTMYNYGIKIYDENGINLDNWYLGAGYFDTLLLDNYTVILSNTANSKVIRIDPQLQCDEN